MNACLIHPFVSNGSAPQRDWHTYVLASGYARYGLAFCLRGRHHYASVKNVMRLRELFRIQTQPRSKNNPLSSPPRYFLRS
jgi:hypothetical protein